MERSGGGGREETRERRGEREGGRGWWEDRVEARVRTAAEREGTNSEWEEKVEVRVDRVEERVEGVSSAQHFDVGSGEVMRVERVVRDATLTSRSSLAAHAREAAWVNSWLTRSATSSSWSSFARTDVRRGGMACQADARTLSSRSAWATRSTSWSAWYGGGEREGGREGRMEMAVRRT